VDGILNCTTPNGFGGKQPGVAKTALGRITADEWLRSRGLWTSAVRTPCSRSLSMPA